MKTIKLTSRQVLELLKIYHVQADYWSADECERVLEEIYNWPLVDHRAERRRVSSYRTIVLTRHALLNPDGATVQDNLESALMKEPDILVIRECLIELFECLLIEKRRRDP